MIAPGERRRRRRAARATLWLAGLAAAAVLLAAGIALGMALHDNPTPNLTVTTTKTLVP